MPSESFELSGRLVAGTGLAQMVTMAFVEVLVVVLVMVLRMVSLVLLSIETAEVEDSPKEVWLPSRVPRVGLMSDVISDEIAVAE